MATAQIPDDNKAGRILLITRGAEALCTPRTVIVRPEIDKQYPSELRAHCLAGQQATGTRGGTAETKYLEECCRFGAMRSGQRPS